MMGTMMGYNGRGESGRRVMVTLFLLSWTTMINCTVKGCTANNETTIPPSPVAKRVSVSPIWFPVISSIRPPKAMAGARNEM